MKVAYLHGLESNNKGAKNDMLRQISTVYDPLIDYCEKHIYFNLKEKIKEFQPDLIIGSSMGGYFAYHIANELNIKAVLFNPALHSRTLEPDMFGLGNKKTNPKTTVILGVNDEVIDPKLTKQKIGNQKNIHFFDYQHGHRTPYDVFKIEVEKTLNH